MSDAEVDLTATIIRDHARGQMALRQISEEQVRLVLAQPEQVLPDRVGRVVAQRMIAVGDPPGGKEYLFRVFVDIDRQPPELVTVYRTSQIRKYRSQP